MLMFRTLAYINFAPCLILVNLEKPKLVRYAPSTKCSFTLVNCAFVLVESLEFRVFRGSR